MGRHDPGAGQYCPISRTLDVVGERWSLLILRDMMTGTTRFNDPRVDCPACHAPC